MSGLERLELTSQLLSLLLRALGVSARDVLEHGEWLAQFTVQSLSALPTEGAAGTDAISRLECAQEAAGLLLTLAAFPSPEPEKLCYNVAMRHAALQLQSITATTGQLQLSRLGQLQRE